MTKAITISRRAEIPSDIPKKVPMLYPKNGRSDWIGLTDEDTKPICYLSGTAGSKEWSEKEFKKATGSVYRCFSYAYCGFGSPLLQGRHAKALDWCLENDGRIFLDSGAHSFHKMRYYDSHLKGKNRIDKITAVDAMIEGFMKTYAQYVRWTYGHGYRFDFYVTFDHEKRCPVIFEATRQLEKMNIYPVPVYHGDESFDWVKRYADQGHKIIGVGKHGIGKNSRSGIRRYYETVINETMKLGMSCHGFAVTGDLLFEFPWYSGDSTTWLKAAAYGKILDIRPEKQRVALIHVSTRFSEKTGYGTMSNLSPETRKYIRQQVESRGFDFDKVQSDLATRATYNARITVEAVAEHTKARKAYRPWSSVY